MKKTMYWSFDNNFGDALNPYLQQAFGIQVKCAPAEYSDLIAIGSSMERLLKNTLNMDYVSNIPIQVWSTGFHFPINKHLWYHNIEVPEQFARSVEIRALRGKISKARAETILNRNLDSITLGDGGLLTSKAFPASKEKIYKLGIVAHMTERQHPIFKEIHKNIKGSTLLNIFDTPDKFIQKLTQCEAIISTALHPLIVADSYRIPNLWINLTKDANISMYKFSDYYSVFGLEANPFDLTKQTFSNTDLKELHNNYGVKDEDVFNIQNALIKAHPYSDNIKYLTSSEIFHLNCIRIKKCFCKLIPLTKLRRQMRKPNTVIK